MMKIYGQVCFKMSTLVITANLIWTKVCHRLEEGDVRVGGVCGEIVKDGVTSTGGHSTEVRRWEVVKREGGGVSDYLCRARHDSS